jgi:glutamate/aspartate transport system ATP-binding protein
MTSAQPPTLEIRNVVKDYRGLRPLRMTSLEVGRGERVALSGLDAPSAEVLVNLVTGASVPDQGEILIEGSSTAAIADGDDWLASLDRFGIVSDRAVLLEGSTLLQNLALPFTIDIDAIVPEIKRRIETLAADVGLAADRLQARVGDLTPADRLRGQVARALALDPGIVLLEHPTARVPRDAVAAVGRDAAAALEKRRTSALAITEDAEFAAAFAVRRLRLNGATGELAPLKSAWRLFGR